MSDTITSTSAPVTPASVSKPSSVTVAAADDMQAAAPTPVAGSASETKYTAAEEYAWAAPSRGMTRFHNSHKHTFNNSYTHAEDYEDAGYTLKGFLRESYNLVVHLGNHHAIEEAYIFPLLARKHPAFRDDAEHKADHAAIHDGLERYQEFLRASMMDGEKYTPKEMREILDSFREPLMRHLDQEVEDIKPDSLKKHGFTLAEVRQLPF